MVETKAPMLDTEEGAAEVLLVGDEREKRRGGVEERLC